MQIECGVVKRRTDVRRITNVVRHTYSRHSDSNAPLTLCVYIHYDSVHTTRRHGGRYVTIDLNDGKKGKSINKSSFERPGHTIDTRKTITPKHVIYILYIHTMRRYYYAFGLNRLLFA